MKKGGVFVTSVLTLSLVVGGITQIKVNATEESNQDGYYEINQESYDDSSNMTYEEYDQLLPVFAALGEEMYTYDVWYDAYKGRFFEKSFVYLIEYLKGTEGFEYTEDENNYYITMDMAKELTKVAFNTGDVTKLEEKFKYESMYYDDALERYVVKKENVSGDYSVKVIEAKNYFNYPETYNYCEIKGELYKGDEKIDEITITVNEYESSVFSFNGVSCVNLKEYGRKELLL